jgi:hypothetical protein
MGRVLLANLPLNDPKMSKNHHFLRERNEPHEPWSPAK